MRLKIPVVWHYGLCKLVFTQDLLAIRVRCLACEPTFSRSLFCFVWKDTKLEKLRALIVNSGAVMFNVDLMQLFRKRCIYTLWLFLLFSVPKCVSTCKLRIVQTFSFLWVLEFKLMDAYCLRHLKAAFVLAVGFKEDHHYTLLHFGTVLFFFLVGEYLRGCLSLCVLLREP